MKTPLAIVLAIISTMASAAPVQYQPAITYFSTNVYLQDSTSTPLHVRMQAVEDASFTNTAINTNSAEWVALVSGVENATSTATGAAAVATSAASTATGAAATASSALSTATGAAAVATSAEGTINALVDGPGLYSHHAGGAQRSLYSITNTLELWLGEYQSANSYAYESWHRYGLGRDGLYVQIFQRTTPGGSFETGTITRLLTWTNIPAATLGGYRPTDFILLTSLSNRALRVGVPESPTNSGSANTYAFTNGYFYWCEPNGYGAGTNWGRVQLGPWAP